jgi:beta-N-acetylhexosaminidase
MVRNPVAFICTILISGGAIALPRPAVLEGPSMAVRVEEPSENRAIPDACRDADESPAWCAPYSLRLQERERPRPEKRPAPLAKPKPLPGPAAVVAAAKPARPAPAGRLLSEQERNAIAPRPLTPSRTGSVKAGIPGKTPEDKLRHMLGQLMLTGFSGQQPGDPDIERITGDLRAGKLAGALVRDSNIESSGQLRRLLEAISDGAGADTPLIAIEQPGGPDTLLPEDKGFAFYNSANAVSSSGNPHEAQIEYRAMAGELAGLGVTLNIGPSEDTCRRQGVDLSALCFGTAPGAVALYARAFKFGHHDRGVLTAFRHVPFRPGLRTTWVKERPSSAMMHLLLKTEPSDALVISVKAMETMRYLDVSLGAARAGKTRGGRGNFHDALIFEMDMPGGAPAIYGETVVRALQSGADMILVREPSTLPAGITALSMASVQSALKSGRLQMSRIEDAYRHAQTLKARLQSLPARAKTAGINRDSVSERVSTSRR